MAKFKYRVRGTNDEQWNEREIEADTVGEAEDKLDELYGVLRDDDGNQTNANVIKVEVLVK